MTQVYETRPGRSQPLGPSRDGEGVNFSVFSSAAQRVFLCLFDETGDETRLEMAAEDGPYWSLWVAGLEPGHRYGFRVDGPFEPSAGVRCNSNLLLLDPYARAIEGSLRWAPAVRGFRGEDPFGPASSEDSAPYVPRSVLVEEGGFDWGSDRPPRRAWSETLIYELHVKGFTARHPGVPQPLRGTYAGVAHPEPIAHLSRLGITAVELMPVQHFEVDEGLHAKGLTNYWGYAPVGYFAPHARYCSSGQRGQQVREFKQMVAALHAAGIEVLLDVVFNHTAEGSESGSTLCFRGFDNRAYYKHAPEAPGRYLDHTGCGNTLHTRHPNVLQLIMDSLRYWVQEMHVDGFRFDLAAALARTAQWVDPYSAFFGAVQQDPVLRDVKLIAEPWDLGSMGYQVGRFPSPWSEWNGVYRDAIRDFWCRGPAGVGEFARRFAGSSDIYRHGRRLPRAGVNIVTCHDGFTLLDLNTYQHKQNEANREGNRDGESHNRGWNCGREGPAASDAVRCLRRRQQRNFLATLLFSQGVPMIGSGDEMGRTQLGNNNAYCHDSELTWLDWDGADESLIRFVADAVRLLKDNPGLRSPGWLEGRAKVAGGPVDIAWYRPDGHEFGMLDWDAAQRRAIAVYRGPTDPPAASRPFLFFFNADGSSVDFTLPPSLGDGWKLVLDSSQDDLQQSSSLLRAGEVVPLPPHSLQVLAQDLGQG